MPRTHPTLLPYKPTPADPFDRGKAAHLLNRAGWGGTSEEIDRVLALGPDGAADWLMDFPDANADEISKSDLPDFSAIESYPKNFNEIRKMMAGKTEKERKELRQKLMQANREAMGATGAWWLKRLAYGPYPLHEKLTFLWHGHFTTSARDERSALLMWQQNETIRHNAAGNFGSFVKQISRDPAMLDYLNNSQNRKARPNENYARELMELFTLGIGKYTENDIKEAARAFTGWAHDGDDFIFRKYDHDNGEKVFFGRRGNFDGDDVIDIILQTDACAQYIGLKFYNWFINENVDGTTAFSTGLSPALGDRLKESNYEMRPLLRTILTSRAFYDPANRGVQIKSPVQLTVGTVRMLDLELPPPRLLRGALEQMGQIPFDPPNVKGWPGGHMWINTSTLFVRQNTAVWLAGGASPIATGKPALDRIAERRGQVNFVPQAGNDAQAVVDQWVERLIPRPVSDEKKQVLIDALGGKPNRPDAVKRMIQLIVSMPEYQLC